MNVYGVDVEEELIKTCLDNYSEHSGNRSVVDRRNLYREELDVVFNWDTSFAYLGGVENTRVLKNLYNALIGKEILIIDHPSYWPSMWESRCMETNIWR